MKNVERIREIIEQSDMVLIGIGDQLSLKNADKDEILKCYHKIYKMVKDKPWFVVTLNTDDLIYESEFHRMLIVAPCGSDASGNVITNENYDESEYLPQWQFYMNWLSGTLGKKLCILELGMGMMYPSVFRIPAERTMLFNHKASLVRIHSSVAFVPEEIEERSLCILENTIKFMDKIDNLD